MREPLKSRSPLFPAAREEGFIFSGQPRKIQPVAAISYLWPKKASVANEYVMDWRSRAALALGRLSLSRDTLNALASHVSRRDGACRLTDKAIAARSGRSVASTKRDIKRLKDLGFLIVEYESGNQQQERVRVLKPAVPNMGRSSQRVPA